MPPYVFGNFMEQKRLALDSAPTYEYKYPFDLDLNPKSNFHKKLLGRVLSMANASAKTMQHRFRSWNAIEEVLNVYTPLSKEEKEVVSKDKRKPVSMVIPASYAILETLLTYNVAAFLEEPYFRYKGVDDSGHDAIGGLLLEKVVHVQAIRNKLALAMHTMWRDGYVYGIGSATPGWKVEMGTRAQKLMDKTWDMDARQMVESFSGRYKEEKAVIFEGSKLTNIDPFMLLLDPYTPIQNIQDGEYIGWVTRTSIMNAIRDEVASDDLGQFNASYLRHMGDARSTYFREGDTVRNKDARGGNVPYSKSFTLSSPCDNLEMYIDLIPNEWGLSNSTEPEKWWFRVSGDAIITGLKPLGLWHNKYPIVVNAPDFDGYGVAPISRLELIQPMAETLNWFISSHITNVRKALNDMWVYDPYVINSNDMSDPEPGKMIRVRRAAWGRGKIKESIMQFPVTDVTQNHVGDVAYFFGEMQKVSSAVDSLLGIERKTSERVTAAEYQGRSSNAVSRLAKAARMTSVMAHQDLAYMLAMHTQQFMSVPSYIRLIGDDAEKLKAEYGTDSDVIAVNPEDINVFVDVTPHDGTVIGGEDPNAWVQIYQATISNPELMQLFDVSRIFMHMARNMGAKNVQEFIKKSPQQQVNAQVLPDDDVMSMIRSGDIAPIGAGGGNGEL